MSETVETNKEEEEEEKEDSVTGGRGDRGRLSLGSKDDRRQKRIVDGGARGEAN